MIIKSFSGLWFTEPNKYPFYDTTRATLMVLELISREEETQVNGVVVIIDLSRINLMSLKEYLWSGFAKVTVSLLQVRLLAHGIIFAEKNAFF